MSTSLKVKTAMIEQRGTPRELAERMAGLPEGQYRVIVQRLRSREDVLASFDRATETLRRNPSREVADLTEDEVMDWSVKMVQEARRSSTSAK